MGWDDELGDMKNEAKSAVKDHVGMATSDADADLEYERRADQRVSNLDQGTEKSKDAFKRD
jgi:uncharacterized protein YjbJ (UPF0337 family)